MSDLRKAAEMALEVMEYNRANGTPNMGAAIEALRQALAQPEQEPVVWVVQYKDRHEFVWGSKPEFRGGTVLAFQPLYMAPPKHEWVGLTDEEYDELMISGDWGGSLIQATEAKLKEKNGG